MTTNIQNVSFVDPAQQAQLLIAQQQAQRNQSLADELRRQSMADIPSNGGAISWTQGAARMMDALAANHLQRRANANAWDIANAQANAAAALHDPTGRTLPQTPTTANPYRQSEQGRNLGQRLRDVIAGGPPVRDTVSGSPVDRGPVGGSASATTDDGQPVQVSSSTVGARPSAPTDPSGLAAGIRAATVAASAPAGNGAAQALAARVRAAAGIAQPTVPNPIYGSGGVEDDGYQRPTMPMAPPASDGPGIAAPGSQPPQTAPLAAGAPSAAGLTFGAPPAVPGNNGPEGGYQAPGQVMDAMLPTMTAREGYLLQANDPQAYWAAVAAAGAPIDDVKRLRQSGIDPGSPQGQALLRSAAAKAMQTPLNDDRRGYLTDPYTGEVRAFHPSIPDGTAPTLDARGNVVGATMLPGVTDARRQVASAEAMGRTDAEVQEVYDPGSGTYRAVPRSAVLGPGGHAGGSIDGQLGARPVSAGSAPSFGYQTRPGLGATAAADVGGKASALAFQQLADSAADTGNRIFALRQMADLNRKVVLGPGSEAATKAAAVFNSIGQAIGLPSSFNNRNVTNIAEFNKWAAQYSARTAQELGLSGSDARMSLTVSATPNSHMTNQAASQIIHTMIGFETASQAHGAAGARWAQQNGLASWQQFSAAWNRAYDPRLYTVQQLPPAEQQRFFRSLSPADRLELGRKAAMLKALGAYQ